MSEKEQGPEQISGQEAEVPELEKSDEKDIIYDLVIKLPEGSEKKEQLERKLKEYEERRAQKEKEGKEESARSMYKRVILSQVVEKGEVKIGDLLEELSKVHNGVDRTAFDNAATIIYYYTMTGGNLVKGGTGLK